MIFHMFLEIYVGFPTDFARQWRAAFSMFIIPMSLTTSHTPTFKLTTRKSTFKLKIRMLVVFMILRRFQKTMTPVMSVTQFNSETIINSMEQVSSLIKSILIFDIIRKRGMVTIRTRKSYFTIFADD